jgi:hypothetical protein
MHVAGTAVDQRFPATKERLGRNRDAPEKFFSSHHDERGDVMKINVLWMIIAAAGLALTGCNQAEAPKDVQHDVADARADAQRDVADAQSDAQENMADAQEDVAEARADDDAADVADQSQEASETAADNSYKVAVAQAEATHQVATEKCDALSGDAQDDCKERADADLEHAKRDAEMRRDGAG